jgi:hypothetical protein
MKTARSILKLSFLIIFLSNILPAEPAFKPDPNCRFVTAAGLKFREKPDLNSKTIQIIPQGKIITVIETKKEKQTITGVEGRWAKARYRWEEGWVFDGFLSDFNINKKDKQLNDITGKWFGTWGCEKNKTNITFNTDKTFTGWTFSGGEMGGCSGDEIKGTWDIESDSNICLTVENNKYYFFIWKGTLIADMNYPGQFRENFGHEILSGLKK